jgi:hypothetical protein
MKTISYLLLLGAVGVIAAAQILSPTDTGDTFRRAIDQKIERVAAGIAATPPAGERIFTLPEDGDRWHTILIYSDKSLRDPADRQLAGTMAATPRLQSLAAQTAVTVWDDRDPLFAARYKHLLGSVRPAIVVQNTSGTVCYKAAGMNIPRDGEQLADEIATSIGSCRPKPAPPATPPVDPPADAIPDLRPEAIPGPIDESLPWFAFPLIAGSAAAGGYAGIRRK